MDEQRLIDLETKLAFQDHTIKELNGVVCELREQLDKVTEACKYLTNRIMNPEDDNNSEFNVDEDRPPHY